MSTIVRVHHDQSWPAAREAIEQGRIYFLETMWRVGSVYRHVADVRVSKDEDTAWILGSGYALTQHIGGPWPENDDVTAVGTEHRSTDVGDVIEFDGRFWVVALVGFKEIRP